MPDFEPTRVVAGLDGPPVPSSTLPAPSEASTGVNGPEGSRPATRQFDRCTVCGSPPCGAPGWIGFADIHRAHPTPTCDDCGVCKDFWPCEDDCPQAPIADVVPTRRNVWMVSSRSNPGAYWPVRLIHIGGRSEMTCPCPAGRRYGREPLESRLACRHMKAVTAFENERHKRPAAPVNVSALVD